MLQRGLISSKGPILLLLCKPSLIGVGSSRVPMLLQDRRKSCARRYLVGIVMNHHAQLLICPSSATVLANADADVEQHTMYVHTCFVRALRCSDPGDRSRSLYWIDKLPLTRSCLFFPGGSAAANPFLGQQQAPPPASPSQAGPAPPQLQTRTLQSGLWGGLRTRHYCTLQTAAFCRSAL